MKKGQQKKPATAPTNSTTAMAAAMTNAGIEPAPSPTPATRAGTREYNEFFSLYSKVVGSASLRCQSLLQALDGKAEGLYFLPLGFIPGPAALLEFKGGKFSVVDATPDVRAALDVPTPWVPVTGQEKESVPGTIWYTLRVRSGLIEELRSEPSPWNMGLARRLLEGEVPSRFLTMVMPRFRYRHGDAEEPFGVALVPSEDEDTVKVSRIHNPGDIPNVPEVGAVLTLDELKDGQGPVQKLLKTWALMESNYSGRYDRYGQPRHRQDHREHDRR